MSQVAVQKRKKVERKKLLETSIDFRVAWADIFLVNAVAYYERRDVAELMRMMVNRMRREYRRDKGFKEWCFRHKDELTKLGIPLEEIF